MIIKLTGLPKISTNKIYAGMHWTKRKKHKDECLWIVKSQFKGQLTKDKQYNVEYTFGFKTKPLDASNCSYMAKIVEDIIFEDDKYNIILSVKYSSVKSTKDNLTIKIQEIAEGEKAELILATKKVTKVVLSKKTK